MKVGFSESERKNVAESVNFEIVFALSDYNNEIIAAEFSHYLAANTAGIAIIHGCVIFGASDNRDCGKFSFAFAYRFEKCGSFRAVGGAECRVFNVAAAIDFSFLSEKSRAYRKTGIRNICHFSCFKSFFYKIAVIHNIILLVDILN